MIHLIIGHNTNKGKKGIISCIAKNYIDYREMEDADSTDEEHSQDNTTY